MVSERAADTAEPEAWVGYAIRVPLLPATNGRYLFAVHPLEGFAFVYGALREYLPAGLGIVGLQDPAHGGIDASLTRGPTSLKCTPMSCDIPQPLPDHIIFWAGLWAPTSRLPLVKNYNDVGNAWRR